MEAGYVFFFYWFVYGTTDKHMNYIGHGSDITFDKLIKLSLKVNWNITKKSLTATEVIRQNYTLFDLHSDRNNVWNKWKLIFWNMNIHSLNKAVCEII